MHLLASAQIAERTNGRIRDRAVAVDDYLRARCQSNRIANCYGCAVDRRHRQRSQALAHVANVGLVHKADPGGLITRLQTYPVRVICRCFY